MSSYKEKIYRYMRIYIFFLERKVTVATSRVGREGFQFPFVFSYHLNFLTLYINCFSSFLSFFFSNKQTVTHSFFYFFWFKPTTHKRFATKIKKKYLPHSNDQNRGEKRCQVINYTQLKLIYIVMLLPPADFAFDVYYIKIGNYFLLMLFCQQIGQEESEGGGQLALEPSHLDSLLCSTLARGSGTQDGRAFWALG